MMSKQWDTWMAAFAGALVGLLASVGHIVAERSGGGPIPIGQVPLYVIGAALAFAALSLVRNRLVKRRAELPSGSS